MRNNLHSRGKTIDYGQQQFLDPNAYTQAIKTLSLSKNSSNANFVGSRRRNIKLNQTSKTPQVVEGYRNTRMSHTINTGLLIDSSLKEDILSK